MVERTLQCTGYTTADKTVTYEWDAEDRLVKITQLSTGNPQLTSEFTYDGFSRWVGIEEKTNGVSGSVKRFVWCGTKVCEERDANGFVIKRFFAEGEQVSGTKYFFTRDHLGSVREMTGMLGSIRARYDYDPYGRRTKVAGDLEADFGFTGHYYHGPSGLHLAVYRAYDADIGRWINRDPIEEEGGMNLYGYVLNNPANVLDRLGLDPSICERLEADIAKYTALLGDTFQGPQAAIQLSIAWAAYVANNCGQDGDPPDNPEPEPIPVPVQPVLEPCPRGYRSPITPYGFMGRPRGVFANPGLVAGSAYAVSVAGFSAAVLATRGRVVRLKPIPLAP